jgi:uncharacterized protein YidB (DUF937 family)
VLGGLFRPKVGMLPWDAGGVQGASGGLGNFFANVVVGPCGPVPSGSGGVQRLVELCGAGASGSRGNSFVGSGEPCGAGALRLAGGLVVRCGCIRLGKGSNRAVRGGFIRFGVWVG